MEMKPAPHYTTNSAYGPVVRPQKRLNGVTIAALVFTLIGIILLAVAVGTNFWIKGTRSYVGGLRTNYTRSHFGLWRRCYDSLCIPVVARPDQSSFVIDFVRGCSLASVGMTLFSVLLLSLALCKKSPKCCSAWAGVILILASLLFAAVIVLFALFFVITAIFSSLYTLRSLFGYSFILACVGDCVIFVSGILSCVGACVEPSEHQGGVIIVS